MILVCKYKDSVFGQYQDVQQKVRPYILALDMSHFKYDDFIRVLDIVNRYNICIHIHVHILCSLAELYDECVFTHKFDYALVECCVHSFMCVG